MGVFGKKAIPDISETAVENVRRLCILTLLSLRAGKADEFSTRSKSITVISGFLRDFAEQLPAEESAAGSPVVEFSTEENVARASATSEHVRVICSQFKRAIETCAEDEAQSLLPGIIEMEATCREALKFLEQSEPDGRETTTSKSA